MLVQIVVLNNLSNAVSASFTTIAIDEMYIGTSKEASRFEDVGKIFASLGKLH
jgi:hypothetical protein